MLKKDLEEKLATVQSELAQAENEIFTLHTFMADSGSELSTANHAVGDAITAIDAYRAIFQNDCAEQLAFDHLKRILIG